MKGQKNNIAETLNLGSDSGVRRRIGRWTTIGGLILILVAGAFLWSFKSNGDAPRYKTREAIRGNLTVTVTATGSLAPTGQVDVGSELSGIIKRVAVDYNDRVEVGQPLAWLDDTNFHAAAMASRAALSSAKARLRLAEATLIQNRQNLARLKKAGALSGGKALSPYDLETAEAGLERAEAEKEEALAAIRQAEANLKVDETNLLKTVIFSPVNGMVLLRDVDPGQTVAASFQAPVLFTLAEDLARMELQVDVDEADVGQIREGQAATFTVDAYPGRNFQAHITQVRFGSQTTDGVVTYKTLLKVDNPDLLLRPGMTATADIIVEKIDDALLIPNAALRFTPPAAETTSGGRGLVGILLPRFPRGEKGERAGKDGSRRVWTLRDGAPVAVAVITGPTDGIHTVVTGGDIKAGIALVTETVNRSE